MVVEGDPKIRAEQQAWTSTRLQQATGLQAQLSALAE